MFWRNKRKLDFSPVSSDSRHSQKVTLNHHVEGIVSYRAKDNIAVFAVDVVIAVVRGLIPFLDSSATFSSNGIDFVKKREFDYITYHLISMLPLSLDSFSNNGNVLSLFPFLCLFVFFLLATSHGAERCSCYTFEHDRLKSWPLAMASCKLINKDLVVIETEQEGKFITMQIQTRNIGKYNKWQIGLCKSLITGNWTWINGMALTVDRWQENRTNDNDSYALIAKEWPPGFKGSFRSITGNTSRGWICEEVTGINTM